MVDAPHELGGRKVLRELSPGKSWVVRDIGERKLVAKLLEADCLLEGKLHPSIRERLERVQELPARRVANLHGVERDGEFTYTVWDFVEGVTFSEAVARGENLGRLARDLVLAVRALHATGLVHGAVHEGNVLVDARGEVWLIDVSPLLWGEERVDARGIVELLRRIGQKVEDVEIIQALEGIVAEDATMPMLERALFTREADHDEDIEENESAHWKSLLWAGLALAIGIGVALWVQRYVTGARMGE
jgi:aminoglycoside phosphotransferase (APT) family kinase protein